jgi:hypothetical protein
METPIVIVIATHFCVYGRNSSLIYFFFEKLMKKGSLQASQSFTQNEMLDNRNYVRNSFRLIIAMSLTK